MDLAVTSELLLRSCYSSLRNMLSNYNREKDYDSHSTRYCGAQTQVGSIREGLLFIHLFVHSINIYQAPATHRALF